MKDKGTEGKKHARFYLFVKRTFDIISSFSVIIIFSWLYVILFLVALIGNGGNAVYSHERMGRNGKKIRIHKFASMKKGADRSFTEEELNEYRKEFKMSEDHRITKVGKFLRKTSLDELPQFFDILFGKISFVGPRPIMEEELELKYRSIGQAEKLLSVKPGLIGWWAVSGRNKLTYSDGKRQAAELYYVDNASVALDIKIMFKAVGAVISANGAK